MFMPSARVWNEMRSETMSLWPVPINNGAEFALLLKAPTHVIKAAYRSCPASITVSATSTPVGTMVSTVFVIADDPKSPLLISCVHRNAEEQLALDQIIRTRQGHFFFFDELSRPVARAQFALNSDASATALSILAAAQNRYVGPWIQTIEEVHDELMALLDPTRVAPSMHATKSADVQLTLTDFHTIHIAAIGDREVREFRLEDADEGYVLEHASWHLLEGLFGANIVHSPQIRDGRQLREVTDILAFCDAGLCFVESKAMAVLSTDPLRSTERRAKNIQKQIDKAIDQLPGAMRSVAAGIPLQTQAGGAIRFPESTGSLRHGMIVVSEMLPSIDWTQVARELLDASQAANAMLHVLDLHELRLLVGVSQNDPVQFMVHLINRFQKLCECKTAMIRARHDGPRLP